MNLRAEIRNFSPALWFVGRFITYYLVANLVYGLYVSTYRPQPDPITHWVTTQTSAVLGWIGEEVKVIDDTGRPNTIIYRGNEGIVSVYEGCNGVNTSIIFVVFILAFGPLDRRLLWFITGGLVALHLLNILRLLGLTLITLYRPDYLYFVHKYLFTAFLYAFIFLFWMVWVRFFALRAPHVNNPA